MNVRRLAHVPPNVGVFQGVTNDKQVLGEQIEFELLKQDLTKLCIFLIISLRQDHPRCVPINNICQKTTVKFK
jgi:hypothetical protein